MAGNEAHDQRAEPSRDPVDDALGRLEERLDRASQAAERLLADAAERVTTGRVAAKPPPAGWQQPEAERDPASPRRSARCCSPCAP